MVLKSRAEEDALVAQRTAELGGGFWARVKAGRECRAPTTVGCVSAVSRDELSDVLDGRLAGSEVAPLKELARSLKAGKEKITVNARDGVVGGIIISLRGTRGASRTSSSCLLFFLDLLCSPLSMDWSRATWRGICESIPTSLSIMKRGPGARRPRASPY